MAVNGHDDTFVINDITLSIPPTEIHIQKEAVNFDWQTLRTKNASKVKSGHGVVSVSFTVMFVDAEQINHQLRPLLAQLRLTPICYVENQYLRQHLMSDAADKNMALILKSLELVFRSDQHDCIVANFEFGWFNYAPYTENLYFKKDINLPIPVKKPSDSLAWQKFYSPELIKYTSIIDLDDSTFEFQYSQYRLGPDIVKPNPVDQINGARDINQVGFAKPLDLKVEAQRLQLVNENKIFSNDGYKPTVIKYPVIEGTDPLVWEKDNRILCNGEKSLIVTAISVVFENIVAALPLLGHQYSTFQHIGSIDPRIIIRIMATSDQARSQINSMWRNLEDNAIKFRHIPQQFLNLKLNNSFIDFCGLKTFITESITDETVPGQPGTYAMTLSLRETKFEANPEALDQEFVSDQKVRNEYIRVLNNSIKIEDVPDQLPTKKAVVGLPDTDKDKYFYDLLVNYASFINRSAGSILADALGARLDEVFSISDTQVLRGIQLYNTLQAADNNDPALALVRKVILDDLVRLNPLGSTITTTTQLQSLDQNLASLADFHETLRSRIDKQIQGVSIDLPEFATAKAIAEQVGSFKGKSAYPDFPVLRTIAQEEGLSDLDLDPDFYFINPIFDSFTSIIDPISWKAAQETARNLYVNNTASTGSTPGDWFNKLGAFFEQGYMSRLQNGSDLKNDILSSTGVPGSNTKDKSISREMTKGVEWPNSASQGIALSTDMSFGRNITSLLPSSKKQTVKSSQSIVHSTDIAKVFTVNPVLSSEEKLIVDSDSFDSPVPGAIISSPFGPRAPAAPGDPPRSTFHEGTDFAVVVGTPVVAAADGVVHFVGTQGNEPGGALGWGQYVTVKHTILGSEYLTLYAHLSEVSVKETQDIKKGQVLGKSGGKRGAFGAGNSPSPHLHFELHNPATVDKNSAVDPEKYIGSILTKVQDISGEGFAFGTSIFDRSVQELRDEIISGQALRMIRAYPTFKLYFVEEDADDERFHGFDDFFNYSAVKSIRVVRSRKIPADLCVIELTNISGILSNRKFRNTRNKKGQVIDDRAFKGDNTPTLEDENNPTAVDTKDENPIASLMLQEGIKILLKLGYANDPDKLTDAFVGEITEVEFNETDDLVTIVCQSYATELTQQIKGIDSPVKRGGWFLSTASAATGQLLSDMLQQPEVLHFGRWRRSHLRGSTPANSNWSLLHNRFEWNPTPQDDNLFPPSADLLKFNGTGTKLANFLIDPRTALSSQQLGVINFVDFHYYIYKTTIWDIFKEMELRHPGCVASPVPYKDNTSGPRMTMFFGLPNQLYFARDPSLKESSRNTFIERTVDKAKGDEILSERLSGVRTDIKSELMNLAKDVGLTESVSTSLKKQYKKYVFNELAKKDMTIKPFRSYHVLTSNNHIISNNIRASSIDVYNTVSVEYTVPITSALVNNVTTEADKLVSRKKDVYTLKADAALPDSEVREMLIQYPSCEGEDMAKAYALGALRNSLRDIYKGEITIIGNPNIKPYDICYIFDQYSDLVGPVEVQQVVHYFSQDSGFITEITPDICVSLNEWSTMSTTDAIGYVAESFIKSYALGFSDNNGLNNNLQKANDVAFTSLGITPPPLKVLGAANVALNSTSLFLGVFAMYKIANWSRMRHPVTFSPLTYKGHPLIAAMGNKTLNNNFITDLKQWFINGVDGIHLGLRDLSDVVQSYVDDPIVARGNLFNLGLDINVQK